MDTFGSEMMSATIPSIRAKHPHAFEQQRIVTTYHELLQRLLVDWMSQMYAATWQVAAVSYDLPSYSMTTVGPTSSDSLPSSSVLDMQDINGLFSATSIAKDPVLPLMNVGERIALPPRTKIHIIAPRLDPRLGEAGEIRLTNKYVTVKVTTRFIGTARGIGEYAVLAGSDNLLVDKVSNLTYELSYEAEFPRWLSGNPNLPDYRDWADKMLTMLNDSFDEQLILRRSRKAKSHPKVPRAR